MTVDARTLSVFLRVLGLGLFALGPLHAVLWHVLDLRGESRKLTSLNARVFFAHLASVVLGWLGCFFVLLLALLHQLGREGS